MYYSLHNYSTGRDSLDLHMVNVPKLLKERMDKQQMPLLPTNSDLRLKKDNSNEKQIIRKRIDELEYELNRLRLQLNNTSSTSDNF